MVELLALKSSIQRTSQRIQRTSVHRWVALPLNYRCAQPLNAQVGCTPLLCRCPAVLPTWTPSPGAGSVGKPFRYHLCLHLCPHLCAGLANLSVTNFARCVALNFAPTFARTFDQRMSGKTRGPGQVTQDTLIAWITISHSLKGN